VNGTLLASFFGTTDHRSLEKIPQNLQNAAIGIEDVRFYQHIGVDPIGITRAFVRTSGGRRQGRSQHHHPAIGPEPFPDPRKDPQRKIREILLALQIERNYSKKEILEMYLNQIYFGEGSYGVESASGFISESTWKT